MSSLFTYNATHFLLTRMTFITYLNYDPGTALVYLLLRTLSFRASLLVCLPAFVYTEEPNLPARGLKIYRRNALTCLPLRVFVFLLNVFIMRGSTYHVGVLGWQSGEQGTRGGVFPHCDMGVWAVKLRRVVIHVPECDGDPSSVQVARVCPATATLE